MSPEEKYILLMEAAYTTEDKNTYYKLMQKADQVLKDAQVAVDRIDSSDNQNKLTFIANDVRANRHSDALRRSLNSTALLKLLKV